MGIRKRLALGVAGAALLAGTAGAVGGAESAWAGSPPVNGTGTLSCTGASGLLKFNPPLNFTGGSSETVGVKVTLTGCNASGGNVTTPNFTGKGKGTISASSNNCTNLAGQQSVSGSVTIKWSGKAGKSKLNTSTLTLTQITGTASGSNGNVGFTFSNQSLSGSFAGSTSGEVDSNQNASEAAAACNSKKGMKKLTLVAGSVSQAATA